MGHGARRQKDKEEFIRFSIRNAQCPMPIAQCPMPIAQCPMPITHYPLPITHYPLPNPQCPTFPQEYLALPVSIFDRDNQSRQVRCALHHQAKA